MQKLSEKVQILLPPDELQMLKKITHTTHQSLGELVRRALRVCYLERKPLAKRLQAAEALKQMNLPVSDWQSMKQEIVRGR